MLPGLVSAPFVYLRLNREEGKRELLAVFSDNKCQSTIAQHWPEVPG